MVDLISQKFHIFFICKFIHSGKFSIQYEQISYTFHMPLTCTVSNISHDYVRTYTMHTGNLQPCTDLVGSVCKCTLETFVPQQLEQKHTATCK